MNLIMYFVNARNVESIAPGTVVFREGDAATAMYVLLEGQAKIVIGERPLETVEPGGIFGELALVDDAPRSATVVTVSECRLVLVGRQEFDLLIRDKPKFARHVMRVMARRLRRMNDAARV